MKLPTFTINSFRQSCLEDAERIRRFMDGKTPMELRANHSIRCIQILRGTLQLHWDQMNEAWITHNPADGNVDARILAQLGVKVEATRVAVVHALRMSGEAISIQVMWNPTTPMDPNPAAQYTSLEDFHRKVMPSAHKNSPHARTPPAGTTVRRPDCPSVADGNRRPTQVTRVVTQRYPTIPQSTRPATTYATAPAAAVVNARGQFMTRPPRCQAAQPAFPRASDNPTIARRKLEEHLGHEVTVNKSTHVPAKMPKGAWQQDVERAMPTTNTNHIEVGRIISIQNTAAGPRYNESASSPNMPRGDPEVIGATSGNLTTYLDINCNAKKTEDTNTVRREATCVEPNVVCPFCPSRLATLQELTDHIDVIHRTKLAAWEPQRPPFTSVNPPVTPASHENAPFSAPTSAHASSERPIDHNNCSPFSRRPYQVHSVETSSSDDEGMDGLEQVEPPTQRLGSLNFPPLNLQYQSQGDNNNAKPAITTANPAHPVKRKALKKATTGRIRPEAVMFDDATTADAYADAYDMPKEVVTLEVEDMPVVVDGEGCICVTCYELIPGSEYASHRTRQDCHSPARPPEAKHDDLSCTATAQRIGRRCSTCHREFKSERAKDSHEPCGVVRQGNPTETNNRRQPKKFTSTTAAELKQQEVRLSTKSTERIVAYRAVIRKPNTKGTYNVNGKVMSKQDINRRIQSLSPYCREHPVHSL